MKETKKINNGISLIVLVITIIVIVILAVAVILSIANNNPIENAKQAVDDNNISTLKEAAETLKSDWIIANEIGNPYKDESGNEISLQDYINNNLSAELTSNGKYIVVASKSYKVSVLTTEEIANGVNAPVYNKESMIPVCFDADGNVYKADSTNKNNNWYSYNDTDKKWANVVTVSSETRQSYLNASVGTQISYDDINGMFVWIPRYAYSIGGGIYKTAGKNSAGNIDIKFLVGTSDSDYDDLISYPRDYDETKLNAGATTPMIVHPVFTDDTAMGGWDRELPGIWVAKYESSSSNPSASNGGGNVTNLDVVIKPTDTSWRNITVNNIFTVCRNMEKANNIYGLTTADEPHMLKNSEWGAVAYLCASKYGKVPTINSSSSFIPKAGGVKSSSTGNEYGIFDLNGGAWEYVAAYYDNGGTGTGSSLVNAALKYKNVYSVSPEEKNDAIQDTVTGKGTLRRNDLWSKGNSYNYIRKRLARANYNLLSNRKGDATYECIQKDHYSYIGMNASNVNDTWLNIASDSTTSSYISNWDSDYTNLGYCSRPFVYRGGYYAHSKGAGLYFLYSYFGKNDIYCGFRVCLSPSTI